MDQTPTPMRHVQPLYVMLIFVCAIIATLFIVYRVGANWFYEDRNFLMTEPLPSQNKPQQANAQASGIGAEIYDHTLNPVQGRLPDATADVPNPVGGMYQNPFE